VSICWDENLSFQQMNSKDKSMTQVRSLRGSYLISLRTRVYSLRCNKHVYVNAQIKITRKRNIYTQNMQKVKINIKGKHVIIIYKIDLHK
jgi:hypothetical protein